MISELGVNRGGGRGVRGGGEGEGGGGANRQHYATGPKIMSQVGWDMQANYRSFPPSTYLGLNN